jgi:hypothetical protein
MATISGVPVQNITSISGVNSTSITVISGIPTSSIPGWPGGSGPSCTTVYFGYSDGRRSAPFDACRAEFIQYELDTSTMKLYQAGQCGGAEALPGYYSDGGTLYDYTNGTLNEIGPCR